MPSLLASVEPAWCAEGLGSPAVHVHLEGLDPAGFTGPLGVRATLVPGPDGDLLRLEPTVDLATFARLLAAHGWRVSREGPVLLANAE